MESMIQKSTGINLGKKERVISVLGAGTLLAISLFRASRGRLPLAVGSGYLLYRGITGKDPVYKALNINRSSLNGRSGIEVYRTITVYRPREEVYSFWRDLENLPTFMQHLEKVEVIRGEADRKRSRWVAKAPLGMKVSWEAEITEDRENELIAWKSLPGSMITNSGRVEFRESPGGKGTEVRVWLKYHPPGGSAAAAFAKIFGDEAEQQIRAELRRFKQLLETGEIATVTGQSSGRMSSVVKERKSERKEYAR